MTNGYDCYQNALAECVNGILKTVLLLHRPKDFSEAIQMVNESVQIYNNEWPKNTDLEEIRFAGDGDFKDGIAGKPGSYKVLSVLLSVLLVDSAVSIAEAEPSQQISS